MKTAFVGVRGHHAYAMHDIPKIEDIEVVGLCAGAAGDDITPLQNWAAGLKYSPKVYDDYISLLDELAQGIIVISGPLELHPEICTQAIMRGINVFCEKPIALTLDELDKIRVAHTKSNVHIASMMGLRYDPAFYTAWKLTQEDAIGPIRMIHAQKSYIFGERPEYYFNRQTYGGTIPWVGSHAIDWIYWFSGRHFRSVSAEHISLGGRYGSVEMCASCLFEMEEGIIASASIDYLRPSEAPSHGDDRVRVVGERGIIEVRDGKVLLLDNKIGNREIPAECSRSIFCDFVSHIRGRSQALIQAQDTFEVTRACLLARESADTHKRLEF